MTKQFLGVTAVAKAVGVHKSSVSRYLGQHPHLNHGDPDGPPEIDLEEFQAHRAANMNPDVMGASEALGADIGHGAAAPGGERRSPESTGQDVPSQLTQAKTTNAVLQARGRLLDYEERVGSVVPREEVVEAHFDIGMTFRQALDGRRDDLAERLATVSDPREIADILRESDTEILDAITNGLKALVEQESEDHATAA